MDIWKYKSKSTGWYYVLESGQMMLIEMEASSTDASVYYMVYTMEFNQEETGQIVFAQIDKDKNGILDEKDMYWANGYGGWTKEKWLEQTEGWLTVDESGVIQPKGAVEWKSCASF